MSGEFYACVMAGGTGTRFWPESTVKKPKQLLKIGTEKPLLNLTLERITPLIPYDRQLIVTGDQIVEQVRDGAPEIPVKNIISEPLRKNTAPCIILAAKIIEKRDPDAVMCVLPSDHLIQRSGEFLSILETAADLAKKKGALITLGITARYPETGYGYIEFGDKAGEQDGREYFSVNEFHEKPKIETAKKYIDSGNFFWNSGMFIWSVSAILKAAQTHLPDLHAAFAPLDNATGPDQIKEAVDEIYPCIDGISVDYGIMEKADNILGIPADIGWNDVGAWTCLEELLDPDENSNHVQGEFIPINSDGCLVSSNSGLTVAIGVKDVIIVHTPNATLVCDKGKAQEIKKIFDVLEKKKLTKYM